MHQRAGLRRGFAVEDEPPAELLLGPRIEAEQLAFLHQAVDEHLREAVGRRAVDEHVLVLLEDAHGDLPAVVGIGRIGVRLAAGIDDRQHVAAAERGLRRVAAIDRAAHDRDLPRRGQVLPVPPAPQDVGLVPLDLRGKSGRVSRSEF